MINLEKSLLFSSLKFLPDVGKVCTFWFYAYQRTVVQVCINVAVFLIVQIKNPYLYFLIFSKMAAEKSNLNCPLEVVERIINCSKELLCLFSEFDSFSIAAADRSEASILSGVKDKLQAALFQVNAVLDGSFIDMDEFLRAKRKESNLKLAVVTNEVANFKTVGFRGSDITTGTKSAKSSKSDKFAGNSSSKCKVLFDMTDDYSEAVFIGALSSEHCHDDVEFVNRSSYSASKKQVIVTPVRVAQKAAKDIPMSPVGQRDFPISLSPDEIKQNRHLRAESYQRILRSQQSLKSTQKPRTQHGPSYADHIIDENAD